MPNTLSIELLANGAKEPPSEVRLFAPITPTCRGIFVFDEQSAKDVAAAFAVLGRDLPMDYEHGSLLGGSGSDPAESAKAAGWFKVSCRPGIGCFATSIQWTARAREKILAREFRYISPTCTLDKGNRVSSILSCALTNSPATLSPAPLILSADSVVPLSAAEKEIARLCGISAEQLLLSRATRPASGERSLTARLLDLP